MSEWLQRPVFEENGDWRMERVEEVPDGTLQRGWTMTIDEFYAFWGQN